MATTVAPDPTATPDHIVQGVSTFLISGYVQSVINNLSTMNNDATVLSRGANQTYQIANAAAMRSFQNPTIADAEALVALRSDNSIAESMLALNNSVASGGQSSKLLWQTLPQGSNPAVKAA